MLEDTLKTLETDQRWQANPLVVHLRLFATSLIEKDYSSSTIELKLWLLANFGKWLGQSGLSDASIDEQLVKRFINARQTEGRLHRGNVATLRQFLDHLRKREVLPPQERPIHEQSPLEEILNRYEKHLRSERGLATPTIINYQPVIRKFLIERFGDAPFLFRELTPPDISRFVLRHFQNISPKRAQLMTTAFRSFFRFLFGHGELQIDLAASVPTVAGWRLSTVPKYLIPEEVHRVLRACDRQTPIGRRNYAILLLLARLGLRAGEVVGLKLNDIDWRAGELIVRGKGLFHDRMPLPSDVGDALACYLRRDRPRCQTRQVFICVRAPRRGFSNASAVTSVVRRALDQADLHPAFKGAHLLRHSLATSMLRSGATMTEIGEVLRHRTPNTTETYAKVDFDGLRSLAHEWPIGGGL
jgi:site-specific recombinase XerD